MCCVLIAALLTDTSWFTHKLQNADKNSCGVCIWIIMNWWCKSAENSAHNTRGGESSKNSQISFFNKRFHFMNDIMDFWREFNKRSGWGLIWQWITIMACVKIFIQLFWHAEWKSVKFLMIKSVLKSYQFKWKLDMSVVG